jgi:hydrophobic/amphiphilic exporter-1 (mainly G- bacteria), HAE1 family
MSISTKVVNRPVLIAIIFALIAIVGIYLVPTLAIDLMPDTSQPMLNVSCAYSGASPETVESKITSVLESALNSVSGLENMTSTSSEGSCSISMEFAYGTDLEQVKNDIRDKLETVNKNLPDDASTPSIIKFDMNSQPIIQILVRGNRSAEEIRQLTEDTIQPLFEQVTGVAQVSVRGGRSKIIRVDIEQNRLEAYGLTVTGIAASLSSQNASLGGGTVTENSVNYLVRTEGEFSTLDDISGTVIATVNGAQIRLSDIGVVKEGYEDASSYARINGEEGVYLSIQKQSGTNTVSVANAIYKKVKQSKKSVPADIDLEIIQDSSEQIRDTLSNLIESFIYGGILALLILFIFLRNIKSTLIMGISIPFSVLVTLLCMYFMGITLNMMTLTGLILGVGMVVDASIVMLENIYVYRERGTKPKIAAILGSHEMIAAITSSTLTSICVFIPIFFFKSQLGMLGELFQELILTVGISLLASLFVAIFLVPVLASKYLVFTPRKQKPLKVRWLKTLDNLVETGLNKLNDAYRAGLNVALKHRAITVLSVIFMFAGALFLVPNMNISLMPRMSDDSVTMNITMPLGTSLDETNAVILQFEQFARDEIKGAKNITATAGSGSGGGMGMMMGGRNSSSYTGSVAITMESKGKKDSDLQAQAKMRAHFKDFPSATITFGRGMMGQMTGSDIDMVMKTDDLDIGLTTANEIVGLLKRQVPEINEPSIDLTEGLPEVEIVIDRERLYAFGLNASAVANEIYANIYGVTATTFVSKGTELSVKLFLNSQDRDNVLDLEKVFVKSPSGYQLAVSNFARIVKGAGPVSVKHENQTRTIHIEASLNGNNRADKVETKIKRVIAENMVIDDSIVISYEGSWQDITAYIKLFVIIITMAILLVFGVMAGQYESFKDPFINLFTIPLMFIGVIIVYALAGQAISMFTMIGLVMLAGIVVNNGIVLVDYTNLLVNRGVPLFQACLEGGVSRLRPVLMTTLTTILGTLPMAISSGENSQMIQPIGLTIIGGLSSSTLITLFFIPVIYYIFNKKKARKA